jgi:hypothetical protein
MLKEKFEGKVRVGVEVGSAVTHISKLSTQSK